MKREINIRCIVCGKEFIRKSNGAKLIHEEKWQRIIFSSTKKVITCRCGSQRTEFVYDYDTTKSLEKTNYKGFLQNPETEKFQIVQKVVLAHREKGEINIQKIADDVCETQDFTITKNSVSILVTYMLENRLFTKQI